MFGVYATAATAVVAVLYLVAYPFVVYFRDSKGLRKYPGFNRLSGVTDLCYCYLSWAGFRSKYLHNVHKQKPIIRIGPNSLSFSDPRAIKDIYGHSTKCTKDHNYIILKGSHTHLIDSVDKQEHSHKRKIMSSAFAIKNLERWEFKVADTTSRLLKAFDHLCTEPLAEGNITPEKSDLTVDFNRWINLFTIEAINLICLSSRLGLLEQGHDQVIAERLDGTQYKARYRESQNLTSFAQATFVWSYQHYHKLVALSKLIPYWRSIWEKAGPWNDVVYHQASERLRRYQAGENLDDFFSSLMDDKNNIPNNLEWGEIVSEVSVIINAGADTTAIALSHLMEFLIQHPQDLKTLRDEVDNALGDDEDEIVAPYDKVKDLPFLKACIDEGLRLMPPTSTGLSRRTPPEGAFICGEWIPGDTGVSMTAYGAHRNQEIFPDPESFRPQRWLDSEERKRMEPYFIPFSTGARGCIGRNISYLEQIVMVASLVHRYEFALPSPSWSVHRHEAFNILVGEMPMKIWRRDCR